MSEIQNLNEKSGFLSFIHEKSMVDQDKECRIFDINYGFSGDTVHLKLTCKFQKKVFHSFKGRQLQ